MRVHVWLFMRLMTIDVFCTRPQYTYVNLRAREPYHFPDDAAIYLVFGVYYQSGFNGGAKPCHKTCETAVLQKGI